MVRYMDQAVTADPVGLRAVRAGMKMYKARWAHERPSTEIMWNSHEFPA